MGAFPGSAVLPAGQEEGVLMPVRTTRRAKRESQNISRWKKQTFPVLGIVGAASYADRSEQTRAFYEAFQLFLNQGR